MLFKLAGLHIQTPEAIIHYIYNKKPSQVGGEREKRGYFFEIGTGVGTGNSGDCQNTTLSFIFTRVLG
jgi:hypothetical protein